MEQIIIDFLIPRVPGLQSIYLFGSHAQNEASPDSDVDLALLTKYEYPITKISNLKMDLVGHLRKDVDLVDLREVALDFRFVILSTATRIHCVDEYYCDSYEVTCFSMYQRFELERADIVRDIQKRGYVRAR